MAASAIPVVHSWPLSSVLWHSRRHREGAIYFVFFSETMVLAFVSHVSPLADVLYPQWVLLGRHTWTMTAMDARVGVRRTDEVGYK